MEISEKSEIELMEDLVRYVKKIANALCDATHHLESISNELNMVNVNLIDIVDGN